VLEAVPPRPRRGGRARRAGAHSRASRSGERRPRECRAPPTRRGNVPATRRVQPGGAVRELERLLRAVASCSTTGRNPPTSSRPWRSRRARPRAARAEIADRARTPSHGGRARHLRERRGPAAARRPAGHLAHAPRDGAPRAA
jgi:hypothetical protein